MGIILENCISCRKSEIHIEMQRNTHYCTRSMQNPTLMSYAPHAKRGRNSGLFLYVEHVRPCFNQKMISIFAVSPALKVYWTWSPSLVSSLPFTRMRQPSRRFLSVRVWAWLEVMEAWMPFSFQSI